jgi:hypothetical protein
MKTMRHAVLYLLLEAALCVAPDTALGKLFRSKMREFSAESDRLPP